MLNNTRSTVFGSWGLFTALGLLMVGNGVLGTVIGVRAELEAFPTFVTGIIMASYYAGFLVGSQVTPRAVFRVGFVRVFAGLASLTSATALIHAVSVVPVVWGLARLVTGFCLAGLYVVAEGWLNELGAGSTRGRLMSVYMVVVMGGLAIGQLGLGLADPASFTLFLFASVLVSLSVLPVSLSVGTAPAIAPSSTPLATRAVWRMAPFGIIAGLATGISNGALLGMGPVYATSAGLSQGAVAAFMSLLLAGAVVLQWPLGALSDRMRRSQSIFIVTSAAATLAVLGANLSPSSPTMLVTVFLLGGLAFPMYSLSLSYVNDVVPRGQTVAASSAFIVVSGLGAIVGPLVASVAMTIFDSGGFFWTIAAVHFGLAAVALARMLFGPRQERAILPFVRVPARIGGYLFAGRRTNGPASGK